MLTLRRSFNEHNYQSICLKRTRLCSGAPCCDYLTASRQPSRCTTAFALCLSNELYALISHTYSFGKLKCQCNAQADIHTQYCTPCTQDGLGQVWTGTWVDFRRHNTGKWYKISQYGTDGLMLYTILLGCDHLPGGVRKCAEVTGIDVVQQVLSQNAVAGRQYTVGSREWLALVGEALVARVSGINANNVGAHITKIRRAICCFRLAVVYNTEPREGLPAFTQRQIGFVPEATAAELQLGGKFVPTEILPQYAAGHINPGTMQPELVTPANSVEGMPDWCGADVSFSPESMRTGLPVLLNSVRFLKPM